MMDGIEISMLLSAGAFTAVTLLVAVRLSMWAQMPMSQFRQSFKHAISIADVLQPLLLVITILTAGSFGLKASGMAALLAFLSAALFLLILVVSLVVLVPLQRKIIVMNSGDEALIKTMRTAWIKGHQGRTMLALTAFILLIIAVML